MKSHIPSLCLHLDLLQLNHPIDTWILLVVYFLQVFQVNLCAFLVQFFVLARFYGTDVSSQHLCCRYCVGVDPLLLLIYINIFFFIFIRPLSGDRHCLLCIFRWFSPNHLPIDWFASHTFASMVRLISVYMTSFIAILSFHFIPYDLCFIILVT
jgi:hypothetical protein